MNGLNNKKSTLFLFCFIADSNNSNFEPLSLLPMLCASSNTTNFKLSKDG